MFLHVFAVSSDVLPVSKQRKRTPKIKSAPVFTVKFPTFCPRKMAQPHSLAKLRLQGNGVAQETLQERLLTSTEASNVGEPGVVSW